MRRPKQLLGLLVCTVLAAAAEPTGVYARFQLVAPADSPCFVRLTANIHKAPWSVAAVVWPEGAKADAAQRVAPGQFTAWFDVRQYLGTHFHGRMQRAGGVAEFPNLNITFVTDEAAPTCQAIIELATAANEQAVVRRFEETFDGPTTSVLVSPDLARDAAELETLWQMSARHLRWAREATGGQRVSPNTLLLQTSFYGGVLEDAEALWLLGFNLVGNQTPAMHEKFPELRQPVGHQWTSFGPHLTRGDIDQQIRRQAAAVQPSTAPNLFGFSDEIACHERIGTNAAALSHFHAWLVDQGIPPSTLGVTQLTEVVPIEDPDVLRQRRQENAAAADRIFYYTTRFRQAAATERLKWLTESFHQHAPHPALTTSLVADHPYFSGTGLGMGMEVPNMAWGNWPLALNWFDLARQQAVDVIGIEDWMGLQYMYGPNYTWEGPQLMGFQAAIMRSGSSGKLPIITWVTPSDETNFLLKATSALAQGAKHLFFWTYGPTCHGTENYWSDLRGAYDGVARYARQLAAAEPIIAPGTTRRTRVALLYSVSADYWQPFGYIHMLERRATYLALVHSQYLVDLLTETDLAAGRLQNYDVLYAADANLTAAAVAAIVDWVRAGGYLYGACGAGSRNEFNEPASGLAELFGIAPEIVAEIQPGEYRVRGNLNRLDYLDEVSLAASSELGAAVTFGALGAKLAVQAAGGQVIGQFRDGAPAAIVNAVGRGRAVYIATCPGLSYLKDAKFVPAELKEQYPQVQRRLFDSFARARGVSRLVELSHPVVEAGVYDAETGSALVLANFTYQPIPRLAVRLPTARAVQSVVSFTHGQLPFKCEPVAAAQPAEGMPDLVVFELPLALNDIVLIR